MCNQIYCNRPSKHFYRLGGIRFSYCNKHKVIAEKIIHSLKRGFFVPFSERIKDAMPTKV